MCARPALPASALVHVRRGHRHRAWLLASLGLRLYLHFFNNYSVTYGSPGAVIILLTWFYIAGLMLLAGAAIDSEIEAAVVEKRLTGETSAATVIAPAA